jgi:NAD(P)-dependent dehydrogenase (short-subunit alcohol dehydrogenase family)
MKIFHLFEPWGFTDSEIPDLTGKTFIVTGANSGLGFGTAEELAKHGADVYMVCRSVKKGEEAKKLMGPVKGTLTVMEMDNTSLASVKKFANNFKALGKPINGLILNAGIMVPPFELTKDGLESQFGVNHIAHFALTKELLPLVEKSQPSTIVSVASLAHWFTVPTGVYLDLDKINDKTKYNPMTWYGQSKLANVLFAKELSRRLGPDSKVYVNVVHPGGVQGNLNRHMTGDNKILQMVDKVAQHIFYWPNRDAALTVLAPAVSPKIFSENIRGKYFVPIARVDPGSKLAQDAELSKKVWDFSEKILKEKGWDSM